MTPKEAWYTRFSVIILIGFMLLSIEYGVKNLVKRYSPRDGFEFLNFLHIREYTNPDIAFGIPMPQFLTITLSAAILAVLGYYIVRYYRDAKMFQVWSLNLIMWGAVANFYDRLKYGEVFDYMTFGGNVFPIFNFADVLIVTGVFFFILGSALYNKKQSKSLSPA